MSASTPEKTNDALKNAGVITLQNECFDTIGGQFICQLIGVITLQNECFDTNRKRAENSQSRCNHTPK